MVLAVTPVEVELKRENEHVPSQLMEAKSALDLKKNNKTVILNHVQVRLTYHAASPCGIARVAMPHGMLGQSSGKPK